MLFDIYDSKTSITILFARKLLPSAIKLGFAPFLLVTLLEATLVLRFSKRLRKR